MWEAIESNRRKSWILISVMGVLLVALGFGIGAIIHPQFGIFGALGALVLWFIMWMVAISSGDSIMLMAAGARKIEHQDAPQLFNIVEEMTIASGGGPMPAVYIIPDDKPNAFAIGRKPEKQAVAVTSGLLRMLDRDELQGVMAHEVGHLRNQDTKFLVLAGVMLGTIVILSDIFVRSVFYGSMGRSRSSSREGGGAQIIIFVLVLLLAILAPILAQVLYFACSRRREYLADASAAQYTRYPEGLASALEKITGHYKGAGRHSMRQQKANRVLAPMYIVNPMQAVAAVGLFSTHPPSEQRVSILRSMAGGASYKEYDEAFRKVSGGEGVIGKRSLAGAAPVGVREASPPEEKKKAAKDRSHDVIQMLGRLENLILLTCVCGVGIKVPPDVRRDSIACPRCMHVNPIPRAREEGGSSGAVYQRKGNGWESVSCPCGSAIQLSPSFTGSSIQCMRCKKSIEIRS